VLANGCGCIASNPALLWLQHRICAAQSRIGVLHIHRVRMGAGGMDALVTLGGGDMRRSLNILQAC
jgi:hypothetical protein